MKQLLNAQRDRLSRSLMKTARAIASDAGWSRLGDELGAPSMLAGLLKLRDAGVCPTAVVDAGACIGDWTRLLLRVFPQARVLMIEPQQCHAETLARLCGQFSGQLDAVGSLLGPPGQDEAAFHVTDDGGGGTGSSVLPENSDVPRHVVRMPMQTLDGLLAQHRFPPPDFIKLDVQGYELEVLKGARNALNSAQFVLLEVSVWQYNAGSPLLGEVVEWMHGQGFRVHDVFDLSRRLGLLVQVDLLFRRDNPALTEVPLPPPVG
jgi:FkbM family methyltransferase